MRYQYDDNAGVAVQHISHQVYRLVSLIPFQGMPDPLAAELLTAAVVYLLVWITVGQWVAERRIYEDNDKRMIISAAARAEKAVAMIFGDNKTGSTPAPEGGPDSDSKPEAKPEAAPEKPEATAPVQVQTTKKAKTDKVSDSYTKSQTAAFKRFMADSKTRPAYAGVIEYEGRNYILDGYKMLSLAGKVSEDLNKVKAPDTFGKLLTVLSDTERTASGLVEMPDLKRLKESIKLWKQLHGNKERPCVKFEFDGFVYLLDANYLAAMLQAMPNCRAFTPAGPNKAMYFTDDIDAGIILPVRYSPENDKPGVHLRPEGMRAA